ncbi:SxtJ family membrane protein [Polynucleobacter sphagniphilus]|uniref:SxtJ family membrane protein n=1 Tax=Polynucleobacter sphagniphilus TaxID=1743169 RepID=UPI0024077556|nr:SxtJ family membrane protein [Polynucleobacter sphagniphilus]MDF9789237.1 cellulose synthase/poly-beta-1,6-N-acetylglucosamine synthase-like glycosyltransferase [Polynucleobacter sphagniphilus]
MQASAHNLEDMPSNQKFGWLFATIFAFGFGYFQLKHSLGWAIVSAFLAILFALLTICVPTALAPLNRAWFALSLFLGKVVSPIVLSIIFFILIVPVAFITRLFGRDALLLKRRQVSSYWVDKEPIESDSFKNQF